MWSRRAVLGAGLLAGCGFAPAYGPDRSGGALRNRLEIAEPDDAFSFDFVDAVEARIGRAPGSDLVLGYAIETIDEGLAITPDQEIQRYNLVGQLRYSVTAQGAETVLTSGEIESFTSYSAIGTTVATRASQTDANRRLAVILADRLVTELLATSVDWAR